MMIEPTSQLEEVLANAVEGMKFAVEGTELVTMYAEYAVKLRAAKDAVEVALPVEDSIQGPFGSARDQALARQKRLEQAFRYAEWCATHLVEDAIYLVGPQEIVVLFEEP